MSSDSYWQTSTVQEHEQKLREINERFMCGKLSCRQDVETELAHIFGEDNLAIKLRDRLLQQVNGKISDKAKERFTETQYFMRVEQIEMDVIQSGFPYEFFQNEATLEEIAELDPYLFGSKTLMLIVIQALKSYIDNGLENDPKAVLLHSLYLQLKNELKAILPFQSDCEDGFIEYLASKDERTELEGARESGSICIVCGSHAVSSKGAEWQCRDCGKRFRKH